MQRNDVYLLYRCIILRISSFLNLAVISYSQLVQIHVHLLADTFHIKGRLSHLSFLTVPKLVYQPLRNSVPINPETKKTLFVTDKSKSLKLLLYWISSSIFFYLRERYFAFGCLSVCAEDSKSCRLFFYEILWRGWNVWVVTADKILVVVRNHDADIGYFLDGNVFYHCGIDNFTNFADNSRSCRRILVWNSWGVRCLTDFGVDQDLEILTKFFTTAIQE